MENKERQILSEIKEMMASLRSQIEALEAKINEFEQPMYQEDTNADYIDPIDLDLDDVPAHDEPEPVEVPDDDLPFDDIPEAVAEPEPEHVEDPEQIELSEPESPSEPETVVEPKPMVEPEPVVELIPSEEPEPVVETEHAVIEPKVAVIDSMTDRQAWRTDMAGTHVRDIRSAISLNDRILFINTLFGQDPMAFQESLTKINQMTSLDEVVSHVVAEHPEWDLESETVYRFMMAVRRKVEE